MIACRWFASCIGRRPYNLILRHIGAAAIVIDQRECEHTDKMTVGADCNEACILVYSQSPCTRTHVFVEKGVDPQGVLVFIFLLLHVGIVD